MSEQSRIQAAAIFQKRHFGPASERNISGLDPHVVAILQILWTTRRQTERQRFAEFTDLGGLAEYAIDVRRNIPFGKQALSPSGE
jgi:hypothetical protein